MKQDVVRQASERQTNGETGFAIGNKGVTGSIGNIDTMGIAGCCTKKLQI